MTWKNTGHTVLERQIFPSLATVTIWRVNQGVSLEADEAVTSAHLPDFFGSGFRLLPGLIHLPLKTKGLSGNATRRPQHIGIQTLADTLYCVISVDFGLTPGFIWVNIADGITESMRVKESQ
jgi:hypothetical protein